MSNKIVLRIIFPFIFLFFSCKQEKENWNNHVAITSKATVIDLSKFKILARENSSIIKDVHFFQLETNEESLIGHVNKVLGNDENILILDKKSTNSVFKFDHLGNFLGKIEREGKGPGEYYFLGDMDLDSKDNLHLLDLKQSKVLKFSIDGKFINEQKFGFMTYKFSALEKGSYIFDQGTRDNSIYEDVDLDYKLITLDSSFEKLNKFFEYTAIYDSPLFPLPTTHNIYRSGDKLNYVKPYEYRIYSPISKNEIVETYRIDFGKFKVPPSFYSNYTNTNSASNVIFDLRKTNYAYNIFNVFETSKYLCFNFFAGSNLHWAVVSKKNKDVYVRNLSKMSLKSYPFLLLPQAVINDQFITILTPEAIQSYIKRWGKDDMKEAGLSILTEHELSMNPILFKWSLQDLP